MTAKRVLVLFAMALAAAGMFPVVSTQPGAHAVAVAQSFLLFYSGVFSLIAFTGAVVWGLLAAERFMAVRYRVLAQGIHRMLGLLGLGFLGTHIVLQILAEHAQAVDAVIPFLDTSDRLVATGLGTIAADLMLVVYVIGKLRGRFVNASRPWVWRIIHGVAYLSWPIAIAHGLTAGRPVKGSWVTVSYVVCLCLVVLALLIRVFRPFPVIRPSGGEPDELVDEPAALPGGGARPRRGPERRGPDRRGPEQRGPEQRGPDRRGNERRGADRRESRPRPRVGETGPLPRVPRESGPIPRVPRESGPLPRVPSEYVPLPRRVPGESGPIPRVPSESGPLPRIPSEFGPPPGVRRETGPLPRVPRESGPMPRVPSESGPIPRLPSESGPMPRLPGESGPMPRVPNETGPMPRVPSETGPMRWVPRESGPIPKVPMPTTSTSAAPAAPAPPAPATPPREAPEAPRERLLIPDRPDVADRPDTTGRPGGARPGSAPDRQRPAEPAEEARQPRHWLDSIERFPLLQQWLPRRGERSKPLVSPDIEEVEFWANLRAETSVWIRRGRR